MSEALRRLYAKQIDEIVEKEVKAQVEKQVKEQVKQATAAKDAYIKKLEAMLGMQTNVSAQS